MKEVITSSISLPGYADYNAVVDYFKADDRIEKLRYIDIENCMTVIKSGWTLIT